MKQLLTFAVLFCIAIAEGFGQKVWYNPISSSQLTYIQNQGWNEDGGNYHRFPNRAKGKVRDKVWQLSCQSAGLSIRFKTDAHDISIKYYCCPLNFKMTGFSYPQRPSIGVADFFLEK